MVSLIITFLAIPLGLWLIIHECKSHKTYQAVFDDFFKQVQNSSLSDASKMQKLRTMLEHNHYHIIMIKDDEIKAQRKIFSMGWLLFSLGFLYIGALFYILYFLKFQKPHTILFHLDLKR